MTSRRGLEGLVVERIRFGDPGVGQRGEDDVEVHPLDGRDLGRQVRIVDRGGQHVEPVSRHHTDR